MNDNVNNVEENGTEAEAMNAVDSVEGAPAEEAVNESAEKKEEAAHEANEDVSADTAEALEEGEVEESKTETYTPHVPVEEDVHFNLTSMAELKKFFHSKKWKGILDKITTGILIALMASPVLILAYIFMWFIFK